MAWRAKEFREYFVTRVGKESSAQSYASNLRKLDEFVGGLDEKIAELGFGPIIEWAKSQDQGPFEDYPSNVRSALKRYVAFLVDAADPDVGSIETTTPQEDIDENEATVFRYERELQAAVRRQLLALESGLIAADGGVERAVATGRIDVLAEAPTGELVVIELKAGTCPAGALEQALGYTDDISSETGKPARTILVASDFPERIRAAARRVPQVKLVTYKLQLAFAVDQDVTR
jgi:Endonuclease NucS